MTSKANIKIPNATDTEVFRLNIFSGEVGKLYGMNIGILNHTNCLIGMQLGVFNIGLSGYQIGILNYFPNGKIPFLVLVNYCNSQKDLP